MTNPIKLKTPMMHGPDGQAIANRLIDRCYDASGKRLKWSPVMALFLLQQIELCRELGESVRGVLHAAKIGYRTYWLFVRGLTLGAAPVPWVPLQQLAQGAGVGLVPLAPVAPQIFEVRERGKTTIRRAEVGYYINVDRVGKSEMKAHLEIAGIECTTDGCPLMRSKSGQRLRAPIGSARFSKLLAESTGK